MMLSDIELTKLKGHLEKLKVVYQGNGEDKHANDIKFLRDMISKISKELTDVNKVIFNKIGINGFIDKIYAGGHLCYYHDKFHNVISEPGLQNHIGDVFEYHTVDIATGKTEIDYRTLIKAVYNSDGEITSIEFK